MRSVGSCGRPSSFLWLFVFFVSPPPLHSAALTSSHSPLRTRKHEAARRLQDKRTDGVTLQPEASFFSKGGRKWSKRPFKGQGEWPAPFGAAAL